MNKKLKSPVIIGGGLAGLLAAHVFKDSIVFEAGKGSQHKALLRFRTPDIGNIVGIPFREVTVQKAVRNPHTGELISGECPINLANAYAKKVTGGVSSRSIRNLSTVKRYVAPPDFSALMANNLGPRLFLERPVTKADLEDIKESGSPIISTMPLPALLALLGRGDDFPVTFGSAKGSQIGVIRIKFAIPCDVYQTIYFPDKVSSLPVYRASITGDVLIIEGLSGRSHFQDDWYSHAERVIAAFGLSIEDLDLSSVTFDDQPLGKIVDLPSKDRAAILYDLTINHGIYSVGRFACWRNILMDDVVKDLERIKNLIDASDYSKRLSLFGK